MDTMDHHLRILTLVAFIVLVSACDTTSYDSNISIDILFLGDTYFGETYQEQRAKEGGENVLKTRGYDFLMDNFAPILREANFVVANLETPITNIDNSPFLGQKDYIHRADVVETPSMLERYGFDLTSLANNHSLDFGMAGLAQTLELLRGKSIDTCGAGLNEDQARMQAVRTFSLGNESLDIGIFCAFEFRQNYQEKFAFYAQDGSGGVNALDIQTIAHDVQLLADKHREIFTVAFLHWGKNYEAVTEEQRRAGRALIEAGIDLVIGHGAHILQEIEFYKDSLIVYNLGNFVFGSPGRYGRHHAPPYSLIARLEFGYQSGSLEKMLRLYPIVTDNKKTNYRARFVDGEEFVEVGTLIAEQRVVGSGFSKQIISGEDRYGWYFEIKLD